MRTAVRLDPELAAAAERLRRVRHIGLTEAVDERAAPFRPRTAGAGVKIDHHESRRGTHSTASAGGAPAHEITEGISPSRGR